MLREIPFKDVDCAVHVGIDYGTAVFTNVEATIHTIGLIPCVAYTTGLARVVLLYFHNADTFESCFVREHLDDPVERPFVEMLIPAVSPVFALSDVLEVPHDDRGDTASICIANKRFGKAMEQVGTLTRSFLVHTA